MKRGAINTKNNGDSMDIGGLAPPDPWTATPQYDQGNWSPTHWSGEVDLAALHGKGKGKKGDFKGKGKGKGKKGWIPWNPWNQQKGGESGPKGDGKGPKGEPKGAGKGKGQPATGKGVGNAPGVFRGYCNWCYAYGHTARYCPQGQPQSAYGIDVQEGESPDQQSYGQPSYDEIENDAIQMSSLIRVDGHHHDHHQCIPWTDNRRVRFGGHENIYIQSNQKVA